MHFYVSMNRFGLMNEFKPVYYRRYVDNIFVLFCWPDHLEKFKSYLNSKHRNIRFTCGKEQNNSVPFLEVLITRTSVQYLCIPNPHLVEFIQISTVSFLREYKVGLILTLSFRTFSIVSIFWRFYSKVGHFKGKDNYL